MKRLAVGLVLMVAATTAWAGTKVLATAKTLPEAIDATNQKVEEEARKHHRCVSSYASVDTCKQLRNGEWECSAVRANQAGSCH